VRLDGTATVFGIVITTTGTEKTDIDLASGTMMMTGMEEATKDLVNGTATVTVRMDPYLD